jgi:hypothetical protein
MAHRLVETSHSDFAVVTDTLRCSTVDCSVASNDGSIHTDGGVCLENGEKGCQWQALLGYPSFEKVADVVQGVVCRAPVSSFVDNRIVREYPELTLKAKLQLQHEDKRLYGVRFQTEFFTRGCHWIPRMFA